MSLLTAPYNASMKLGSGFNSYTQQLCIDHAVIHDDAVTKVPGQDQLPVGTVQEIAQSVTFKTEIIDKISDLTDALNINGNLTVKAAGIANATGSGNFVNSNKIKESDLNFLITCKVINQTLNDENLVKFVPLPNLKSEDFTTVYGDSFISGFQIGGEFNALISIKVRDQAQLEEISAKATLAFTTPGFTDKKAPADGATPASSTPAAGSGSGGSGLSIDADAQISKTRNDLMSENETTISVSWTGGGQMLKSPTADWNYETLREAAIKFPELVARTPVRTNAILTKYTALKSFYTATSQQNQFEPLSYENAGIYSTMLQDAYLDYKNIYKELHLLGLDVGANKKTLEAAPVPKAVPARKQIETGSEAPKAPPQAPPSSSTATKVSGDQDEGSDNKDSDTADSKAVVPVPAPPAIVNVKPYIITELYDPSIAGLEQAKQDTRIMMNRIVNEVDAVTRNPQVATQENRPQPYMAAALFKQYLPIGKAVAA